jgi:hypothetical protein
VIVVLRFVEALTELSEGVGKIAREAHADLSRSGKTDPDSHFAVSRLESIQAAMERLGSAARKASGGSIRGLRSALPDMRRAVSVIPM